MIDYELIKNGSTKKVLNHNKNLYVYEICKLILHK